MKAGLRKAGAESCLDMEGLKSDRCGACAKDCILSGLRCFAAAAKELGTVGFGGDVGASAGTGSRARSVFFLECRCAFTIRRQGHTRCVLPLDLSKGTRRVNGRTIVPLKVHWAVRLSLGHLGRW